MARAASGAPDGTAAATSGGAGAKHQFVFIDRLLATLVSLRHGTTHDVLACWFGVDRSTITRAIGEVRPLLAQRGCTIAPDVRLRTLANVIEYLGVDGRTGIIDGTEVRVRRPAAGLKDRDKFVSGKTTQNAVKSMVVTDAEGRVLFCSPVWPGSCADITQARQLGLVQLLADGPFLEILADAGYQGMGGTDRRTSTDATTSHIQEERPCLVRGAARTPAQSALLTPDPRRARHRAPQEPAGSDPTLWPTRAHERHRPSRRRTALTPADRHPRSRPSSPNTKNATHLDVPRPTLHEVVGPGYPIGTLTAWQHSTWTSPTRSSKTCGTQPGNTA
ncbi:transposase family protein [Streptomyces sp. NPDC001002]